MSSDKEIKNEVINCLKFFSSEVSELYLPKEIAVINEIPEPLEFYRHWVAPNLPVLIKGGIKHWPAVKKWNKKYFCEKFQGKKISVAVTPDGYADAITEKVVDDRIIEFFVLPEERLMTVSDFFNKLDNGAEYSDPKVKESQGVFYLQKQNSNLSEEFPELLSDIDKDLCWASETFHSNPIAINLWIGDKRAISSLHKDPFENIYCVVSGSKEFILLPPTDRPWLPYKTAPVGQYKETSPGIFEIIEFSSNPWSSTTDFGKARKSWDSVADKNHVPWITIDPSNPDYAKYPFYKNASPLKVRVDAGDMFYLPSFWFHYVSQSHKCMAVNYWYDMNLDIKYAYFQLLEHLSKSFNISDTSCPI